MRKNRLGILVPVLALAAAWLFLGCASSETEPYDPGPLKGGIVAYLPNYRSAPTNDQLDRITHLALFSIVPKNHNVAMPTGGWASNIKNVVNRAHDRGVKVVICLGGWGGTGSFPESVKQENRATFVSNIVKLVNDHNLDGVDIDWEYPESAEDVANFEKFMVDLKASLGDKRLSFAIGAQFQPSKYSKETYDALDALHLMTYDGQGGGRSHHADMAWSKGVVDRWVNSDQIATEKIFFGVPFYGRPSTGWDDEATYSQLIAGNQAANSQTDHATYKGVVYYYDGIPQIREKTNYAIDKGIGGMMFWELGQDVPAASQYSLLSAICEEMRVEK